MILRCELMVFEEAVELLKVASVESHDSLSLQHWLVELQFITLWQGPEKPSQSFDLSTLLQDLWEFGLELVNNCLSFTIFKNSHLTNASDLFLRKAKTRKSLSVWRSVLCRGQHDCSAAAIVVVHQIICIICATATVVVVGQETTAAGQSCSCWS